MGIGYYNYTPVYDYDVEHAMWMFNHMSDEARRLVNQMMHQVSFDEFLRLQSGSITRDECKKLDDQLREWIFSQEMSESTRRELESIDRSMGDYDRQYSTYRKALRYRR